VHCYADDPQLYVYCRPSAPAATARLLRCVQIIWMGSRQHLAVLDTATPLRLHDGTLITPSTSVRNLGFIFDGELLMAEHVNALCRSCFYQLRQLRFIRCSLPRESAELLVHAFVSSRVDYCNSLLYGASTHVTRKLQAVLNTAARLITGLRRYDHITPALRDDLHWLLVKQRITYKVALLGRPPMFYNWPTSYALTC
jgi:hypothetical protein